MLKQLWHPENRRTLQVALPIIVANMVQILMGIIDSAMVGTISSELLAASSLVTNVVTIPYILVMGMTAAIPPLVAAARSSTGSREPFDILVNGLVITAVAAILLAVSIHLGSGVIHHMKQDPVVAQLGEPFLIIMGWSIIPMALFLAIKHFADGLEYTRIPMYLSLAAIPVNILFNYMFIFGNWGAPRLELVGAGIGTLLARIFMFAGMLITLFYSPAFSEYIAGWRERLHLSRAMLRKILRIGIPSSMQYAMEAWAFAVSGIIIGWLGHIVQASHQIALSLASATFMVSMGLSAAGSIRVGTAFGRQDIAHARLIGRGTLHMSVVYGIACALFFIAFRHQLPLLFNQEVAVVVTASNLLLLAAIFQISDASQAIGVGLLRGLQDVRIPTLYVTLAYWVIGIPLGCILAFSLDMGANGIWIGLVMGLSVSAVLLNRRFLQLTSRRQSPPVSA